MTVKELIDILSKANPDDLVVLSIDSEGNEYRVVWTVELTDCKYHKKDRMISLRELTENHKNLGYTEEDVREGGKNCVVIWPE